jgi:TetR/AcrR family transcriptional regulator, transcriptional repressor for nem operon
MTKGAETRERIVARAAELFNTQGYGTTAIADVMAAVDLKKGGIYRHFASKDELALAAFDYAVGQVQHRFADALAKTTSAADFLLAFIGVFRSYVEQQPFVGGCPILNTAIESDDGRPLLRERAQMAISAWHDLLRTRTQHGIIRGELRPEVDPDRLSVLLIATLEGAVMMSRLMNDPNPLLWTTEHLAQYIDNQVRAVRP